MAEKHESLGRSGPGREAHESDVYKALKSMRWAIPESEGDVRRAEAELPASEGPLPESLSDAGAVFEGKAAGGSADPTVVSFPGDAASEEHLARAAREGGKIPPEIEERMRRDREAAEDAPGQEEPGS